MLKTTPTNPAVTTHSLRRQKERAVLDHVFTVVLDKNPVDDPEYFNWMTSTQTETMDDLMTMAMNTSLFERTIYDNNGNMELPTPDMVENIKIFRVFYNFLYVNNNKRLMDSDDWTTITSEEYYRFKTLTYYTYEPDYTSRPIKSSPPLDEEEPDSNSDDDEDADEQETDVVLDVFNDPESADNDDEAVQASDEALDDDIRYTP